MPKFTDIADNIFNEVFDVNVLEENKVTNLMKIPEKIKGGEQDHYDYIEENHNHQIDILYLPTDENTGDKYVLVVIDTSSRSLDARPLKTMKITEIIEKLKDIYNGSFLELPKMITADKQFDNSEFKNAFKVQYKINRVGRHRQNAYVEFINYMLGRVMHKRMNAEELYNFDYSGKMIFILHHGLTI
jgi:hypothetical protein